LTLSSKNAIADIEMPIGKTKNATKIFSYVIGLSSGSSSQGSGDFNSI
jgi:hypothetical protein